jgi:uncharacterized membrane protein
MHDAVYYGILIATSLAFAVMIFGLVFLYNKAKNSKSGDK